MCSSKPVQDTAMVLATGGLAAPFIMMREQKQMIRDQENAQKDAMAKQDAKDAEAIAAYEKIGPAAKSFDLTQDANATTALKRSRANLQAGIMGTIKTNSLASAPAAAISKTTLGS